MSDNELFPVPAEWAERGLANKARYEEMYARSVSDPEGFWRDQGKRIDWIKPYNQVKDVSYAYDDVHIR